jgi:hypothetical protein
MTQNVRDPTQNNFLPCFNESPSRHLWRPRGMRAAQSTHGGTLNQFDCCSLLLAHLQACLAFLEKPFPAKSLIEPLKQASAGSRRRAARH